MTKPAKYKSLRGMPDLLPDTLRVVRWIELAAHKIFKRSGYKEISTPLLEETEVFTRSIGEDTDIVEKEMYSFTDRGGKNISLRPEGTASIVRAYIEHGWHNTEGLVKLYYSGPMFRGERPQKGRLRQFHQVGAEIIGSSNPYIDVEIISNLDMLLKELKIEGFTILINSLGCNKDRALYKKELSSYLKKELSHLCEDCVRRSKTNVLRVLDCKKDSCREVVKASPKAVKYLCASCSRSYELLKSSLKEMKVAFKEKSDLVRGLDYYTGVIFEAVHPSLGAQDAIAAGGRYDNLVKEMGGPDAGATGYAVGVERLILAVDSKNIPRERLGVLIVPMGEEALKASSVIFSSLQLEEVPSEVDLSERSFKGALRKAHKDGRKFVIIIGENEIKAKKVLLKDMEKGEQEMLTLQEAIKKVKRAL